MRQISHSPTKNSRSNSSGHPRDHATHFHSNLDGDEDSTTPSPKTLLAIIAVPALILFIFLGSTAQRENVLSAEEEGVVLDLGEDTSGTNITDIDIIEEDFSTENNELSDYIPPIAWLMSFPNSGTTYTNLLVRTVSGFNTASNYGGYDEGWGTNTPIFEDMPEGPFYSGDPNKNKTEYTMPTSGYMLSKTHCGSYCGHCLPREYLSDATQFAKACSRSSHPAQSDNEVKVHASYNNTIVKKAVHLIRNPLDNMVARFHHHQKKLDRENLPQKYESSKEGFRERCRDLDEQYYNATIASPAYSNVLDILEDIPCHADFFRYVQWHNLAFVTTSHDGLDLPSMILHYENYTHHYNETVELLHEFLELKRKYEPPLFVTGKVYRDYFEEREIEKVVSFFQRLTSNKTWEHTRHYFEQ